MTPVTCRQTAKNRDQLRNPTLGNRVCATLPFLQRGRVLPELVLPVLPCARRPPRPRRLVVRRPATGQLLRRHHALPVRPPAMRPGRGELGVQRRVRRPAQRHRHRAEGRLPRQRYICSGGSRGVQGVQATALSFRCLF